MEREHIETPALTELGTVSGDTLGSIGRVEEGFASQPVGGISDE